MLQYSAKMNSSLMSCQCISFHCHKISQVPPSPPVSSRPWNNTISTLIPVESAGSFGDGRCSHPSGYLQIDGIRLCLSISRCIDAASLPGSCGTLRAATESQSSAHPPRCLVRPFRDCPSSSGTGYSVPSRALGVRRTVPPLRGCGMRSRLPHPFVLACSRKAHPLGSSAEADDYNSTFPRSRFHGLGCPRSFDSLAPGSARPFGSRHSGIYPSLSQGHVLPSLSPKSLRKFHQTNRVNGIRSRLKSLSPSLLLFRFPMQILGL
jgi:hypothetical protein